MSEVIEQPAEVVVEPAQPIIEPIGMRSFRDMQGENSPVPDVPTPTPVPDAKPDPIPETPKLEPIVTPAPAPEPLDKYKPFGIDESQKEDFEKYVTAWKTGKIDEFVRMKNTDYDSMPAEELIRIDLKKENPLATPKQLDILHKQYLKSLGVTEFADDADSQEAMEIYNLRAEKMRDALKSEKAAYQLPEYKPAESAPQIDHEKMRSEMLQTVQADPNFQSFATNRMITMGSGEESYKYEVPNTVDMLSATVDADGLARLVTDKQGNFDMGKWIKLVAYAADMDKVESSLINFGKSKAQKSNFESLNNPKPDIIPAQPIASDSIQVIGQRSYRDLR